MSQELVRYETSDGVTVITMDDGKANALSPAMLGQLDAAFDHAEEHGDAVLLTGRPGRFSGGFDLGVMLSGPDAARELLKQGAEFFLRVYEFPKPVVVANNGHAIAGGALLMATADIRFGARGDFKIGLNEVTNSMPVPILAHQLARDRLNPRHFVPSVLHAKIYDPDGAVEAGWLDHCTPTESLFDIAHAEAKRLSELPNHAYRLTKSGIRRASIDHIRSTLDSNLDSLLGG